MACTCNDGFPSCPGFSFIQEKYGEIYHILRKLSELLECELSFCITGSHINLLKQYFHLMPQAHFINDLPFVCRLLELIPEKMYQNEMFKEYYEKYLFLCGIPPLLLRSSELITSSRDLEEYFSVLGGLLLYLKDEDHINIIINCLISLLSGEIRWPPCFISLERLIEAACKSRLPQIAGRFLSFVHEEVYEKIMKICIIMSEHSSVACYKMIKEDVVDSILLRLDPTFHQHAENYNSSSLIIDHVCHYEHTSDLIWSLLKSLKGSPTKTIETFPPPTRFSFWSLQKTLRYFYRRKQSKVDRNNMLAILLKIVQTFPRTEFINSGLAQDVIELNLVVEGEVVPHSIWNEIQMTTSLEDFIFVRLLLMFLPHFNKDEYYGGMQYLRETSIIRLKLKMFTPLHFVKWHKDQVDKLICITVSVLAEVACETIEFFLAEKGVIKFMEVIPEIGHNIEVNLSMLRSLIIMGKLTKVKSGMILNRILDIKGHFTLIAYCEFILAKETFVYKNQIAVTYAFGILEKLFKRKTNLANRRLVKLAINFLKRIQTPRSRDPVIVPKLPIMILSCLWNILLCDEENLKQFIECEGVYITLDLAECCVWPVKVTALGLLSEISEESIAIPFFTTWRGKRCQKILPFLMQVFREENAMLGVKHNADGLILDVELPVMGEEQYKILSNSHNDLTTSPAISDMIGSCRAKVYSILVMLTYQHEEEVRLSNEVYKMWDQELSVIDQITRAVAENFFALKIGEVWEELQLHFERCSVRPLANDFETLSIVFKRAKKWGVFIQQRQRDIIRANKEKEEIKENILYMELREARLGQSLGACSELDYIARCTKELYRIRAKRKQNLILIEQEVAKPDPNILYHTTFMYDIMVNPIFDQMLHIANVPNNVEEKPQIPQWKKRALQKANKPIYTEVPPAKEDHLWGSVVAEKCMNR